MECRKEKAANKGRELNLIRSEHVLKWKPRGFSIVSIPASHHGSHCFSMAREKAHASAMR